MHFPPKPQKSTSPQYCIFPTKLQKMNFSAKTAKTNFPTKTTKTHFHAKTAKKKHIFLSKPQNDFFPQKKHKTNLSSNPRKHIFCKTTKNNFQPKRKKCIFLLKLQKRIVPSKPQTCNFTLKMN